MNAIFGFLLQGTGALILTASAQSPAAVVEEIQGGARPRPPPMGL
ncbi:MAG: hypothetical protein WAM72_26105 [Xanthobacteraceae bacterium]